MAGWGASDGGRSKCRKSYIYEEEREGEGSDWQVYIIIESTAQNKLIKTKIFNLILFYIVLKCVLSISNIKSLQYSHFKLG